jgi:hypothetical protein
MFVIWFIFNSIRFIIAICLGLITADFVLGDIFEMENGKAILFFGFILGLFINYGIKSWIREKF